MDDTSHFSGAITCVCYVEYLAVGRLRLKLMMRGKQNSMPANSARKPTPARRPGHGAAAETYAPTQHPASANDVATDTSQPDVKSLETSVLGAVRGAITEYAATSGVQPDLSDIDVNIEKVAEGEAGGRSAEPDRKPSSGAWARSHRRFAGAIATVSPALAVVGLRNGPRIALTVAATSLVLVVATGAAFVYDASIFRQGPGSALAGWRATIVTKLPPLPSPHPSRLPAKKRSGTN